MAEISADLTHLGLTVELLVSDQGTARHIQERAQTHGIRGAIDERGEDGWRVTLMVSERPDSEDFDVLVHIAENASQGVFDTQSRR